MQVIQDIDFIRDTDCIQYSINDKDSSEQELMDTVKVFEMLDELLYNLDEYNFYHATFSLIESVWFDAEEKIEIFVDKLFDAVKYRPKKTELYLKMCQEICNHIPQLVQYISKVALSMPRDNMFFAYKWLINYPEDLKKAFGKNFYITDDAVLWFAPELEEITNNAFDRKLLGMLSRAADDPLIQSFTNELSELREDDWRLYREKRDLGINQSNSAAVALRCDDLEAFQIIASNDENNMNMNQRIEPSLFERCGMVNHRPTWILYAAFFGSIKCFKFLIMNNADLNLCDDPSMGNDLMRANGRSLAMFAVAGGNTEIIRICFDKLADFEGCNEVAQEYHHNAIAEWIELFAENHHITNLFESGKAE